MSTSTIQGLNVNNRTEYVIKPIRLEIDAYQLSKNLLGAAVIVIQRIESFLHFGLSGGTFDILVIHLHDLLTTNIDIGKSILERAPLYFGTGIILEQMKQKECHKIRAIQLQSE